MRQAKGDFRGYKRGTLLRRIERRMGLGQVATLADYLRLLQEDPEEVTRLSQDMLIGVTSFFRDREAFEELREQAISAAGAGEGGGDAAARLGAGLRDRGGGLLHRHAAVRGDWRPPAETRPVNVFASDIDEEALAARPRRCVS